MDIYRLMHALFHIKTVIIPRDRYRSRDDNSPDMEKGMHWYIYHIFQHWINKNKINLLRVRLPKRQQLFPRFTSTFSKRQLTVGRKWRHGAHERLDIVLSEFCPDGRYRCGTSVVYVWAKLTLLLINMW